MAIFTLVESVWLLESDGTVFINPAQHNSPQRFQEYFDNTLEKLIASNKSVYIMGDFNMNLLHTESFRYAQEFLLSLQSFSFTPTINKPTRVQ